MALSSDPRCRHARPTKQLKPDLRLFTTVIRVRNLKFDI